MCNDSPFAYLIAQKGLRKRVDSTDVDYKLFLEHCQQFQSETFYLIFFIMG